MIGHVNTHSGMIRGGTRKDGIVEGPGHLNVYHPSDLRAADPATSAHRANWRSALKKSLKPQTSNRTTVCNVLPSSRRRLTLPGTLSITNLVLVELTFITNLVLTLPFDVAAVLCCPCVHAKLCAIVSAEPSPSIEHVSCCSCCCCCCSGEHFCRAWCPDWCPAWCPTRSNMLCHIIGAKLGERGTRGFYIQNLSPRGRKESLGGKMLTPLAGCGHGK